jgi:hypothetical protein
VWYIDICLRWNVGEVLTTKLLPFIKTTDDARVSTLDGVKAGSMADSMAAFRKSSLVEQRA